MIAVPGGIARPTRGPCRRIRRRRDAPGRVVPAQRTEARRPSQAERQLFRHGACGSRLVLHPVVRLFESTKLPPQDRPLAQVIRCSPLILDETKIRQLQTHISCLWIQGEGRAGRLGERASRRRGGEPVRHASNDHSSGKRPCSTARRACWGAGPARTPRSPMRRSRRSTPGLGEMAVANSSLERRLEPWSGTGGATLRHQRPWNSLA